MSAIDPEQTMAVDSSIVPRWIPKRTFTFADFSDPGTTKTISIPVEDLAAIHALIEKSSQAFSGGTIATYVINIVFKDDLGNQVGSFSPYAVQNAPSNQFYIVSNNALSGGGAGAGVDALPFFGGGSIEITAQCLGDTLNNATQGSLDIWILKSTLS